MNTTISINQIQTFVLDLEKLLLTEFEASSYEINSTAPILRKLLIDSVNIGAFNRFLGIDEKILLNDIISEFTFWDELRKNIRVHIPHIECLPGVIIDNYTGIGIDFIQKESEAKRPNHHQPKLTSSNSVTLDNFINSKWIIVNGEYFTKNDLIQYLCYLAGMVHYGAKDKKFQRLSKIEKFSFAEAQGQNTDCLFSFTTRYKTTLDEARFKDNMGSVLTLGSKHEFISVMILEIIHILLSSRSIIKIYEKAKEYLINHSPIFRQFLINDIFTLKLSSNILNNNNEAATFKSSDSGDDEVLTQCNKLIQFEDPEEQDLALLDLSAKYPGNSFILFTQAYISHKRGQFKKSRRFYELILDKYPNDADCHYNLANILAEHFKEYDLAEAHYKKALLYKPDFDAIYFNYANLLLLHFDNYKLAKQYYEKTIAINPSHSGAYNNLGLLVMQHLKEYPVAKKHFEQAIILDAQNSDAYNNYANLLQLHYKEYDRAQELYERAIFINPANAQAYNNYGALLIERKDYENAEEQFNKALLINPNYVDVYLNLAILFEKEVKDYSKSQKQYELVLELEPNSAKAHYGLGRLFETAFNDNVQAKQRYEMALNIDPEFVLAHNNLANILRCDEFKDYDNSKSHYEEAIKLDPTYSSAKFNLGLLYLERFADYDKATEQFESVIQLQPDHFQSNLQLGKLHLLHYKDSENARTYYEKALSIDPGNFEVHGNYALLLLNYTIEYEKALFHFEKSIEINPNNADAYDGLGFLFVKTRLFQKAREQLELALIKNPNHLNANYNLATLLYAEFHEYDSAIIHYKKVISIDNNRADAHFFLSQVLMLNPNEFEKAKKHYLIACKINGLYKNIESEKIFGFS